MARGASGKRGHLTLDAVDAALQADPLALAALTPAESAARLEELVMQAPLKVHARIFKRLLEAHPDWLEEDSWSEA